MPAWLVVPRYRRLALRNVSVAFGGDRSIRELKKLVRLHFRRLGANLLSSVKISSMSPEQIEERAEFQNLEPMGSALRAGVPVVLFLSHLSNWELFSPLLSRWFPFVQPASVYQRLSNRWIDAHVQRDRTRTGLLLFDRSKGFKPVIDFLRDSG